MGDAERVVRLQGASNFRDLGGYATVDGRRVRWGRLYRSDHLGGLTADDHGELARRGITRAFDFRGVDEAAADPYQVPGLTQHRLSIEPSVAQRMDALVQAGLPLTAPRMTQLMTELYGRLVDEHAGRYAEFFAHLLGDAGQAPLVFHCTAGKDRTGLAAALLLQALGVPQDVVAHDFLLSNTLYRRVHAPSARAIPDDALAVLWGVQIDYLHHAWQAMHAQAGGVDGYLAQRLGVDAAARRRLAERFLDAD